MRLTATVNGMQALKGRLVDRLPAKLRARITEVLDKGAGNIARQARSTVPRDTGALAATIHQTAVREDKRGRLIVSVVAGNKATEEAGVGGTFQRARLVEFGARGTPAEPFLLPAYRAQKKSIQASVRRAINLAVRGQ